MFEVFSVGPSVHQIVNVSKDELKGIPLTSAQITKVKGEGHCDNT